MMLMMMMSFKIHREIKRNGLAPLKIIRLKYSMRQWWDNQPQTKNKKRQQKIFFFFFFFYNRLLPSSFSLYILFAPPPLFRIFFSLLSTQGFTTSLKRQNKEEKIVSNQINWNLLRSRESYYLNSFVYHHHHYLALL